MTSYGFASVSIYMFPLATISIRPGQRIAMHGIPGKNPLGLLTA